MTMESGELIMNELRDIRAKMEQTSTDIHGRVTALQANLVDRIHNVDLRVEQGNKDVEHIFRRIGDLPSKSLIRVLVTLLVAVIGGLSVAVAAFFMRGGAAH